MLYENDATFTAIMVGGKHVHVRLIMKDALYITQAVGTPWGDPTDPGMSPTIVDNATVLHQHHTNNK